MARRSRSRFSVAALSALILVTGAIPAPTFAGTPSETDQATTIPSAPAAKAPDPVELPELRTETSQTFDLGNGQYRAEFASDAIFYRAEPGGPWSPIELDFAPAGQGRLAAVTRSPVRVHVGGQADGVVAIEASGRRIAYRPLQPADVAAGRAGVWLPETVPAPAAGTRAADLVGILPGVDLRVVAQPHGVKTFLVLAEPPATNAFTFLVSSPGLTLQEAKDGALDFVDDSGTPFAAMPAPYAVDSTPDEFTGSGRTTTAVSYALGTAGTAQTVTIRVDPEWLKSAVYPVYVDPTTTIYSAGSSAYGDTHVNEGNPSFNYANYLRPDAPGYYEMWLGESPSNSTYWNEDFIKFDTATSSAAGKVVDSASLEVRPYHQYYDAPTAVNTWARRVTTSWTEAIVWTTKPTVTSTGVTYEGCIEGLQCAFDVTTWARGWIDGTYPNHGVQLSETGTDNVRRGPTYWKRLIASEEGGTARPRLIVTYHDPVGLVYPSSGPTSSRTVSWATDAVWGQSAFSVQVATDAAFTAIVAQSGTVVSAAASWSIPLATAVTPGTTYYWRVQARSTKATRPGAPGPGAPSSLTSPSSAVRPSTAPRRGTSAAATASRSTPRPSTRSSAIRSSACRSAARRSPSASSTTATIRAVSGLGPAGAWTSSAG